MQRVERRDDIDRAEDLQEQDELLTELAAEGVEISEVDAALQRLHAGTYGICTATGRPIPAARLRAVPCTRFTHDAAKLRETTQK